MLIDVSHYQGTINWELVLNYGIEGAFVKASDGYFMGPNWTGHIDSEFQTNWTALGNNYVIRGAYHFLRLNYDRYAGYPDLEKQAEIFANTVNPRASDMVVLDIEPPHSQISYLGKSEIRSRVIAALNIFGEKLGRKPIIYTAQWWWAEYFTDKDDFSDYDLWSAHYWSIWQLGPKKNSPIYINAKPQHVNSFGPSVFWQYSAVGKVPGIAGSVDLNYYMSDIPLEDYVGIDPELPPEPPQDVIELDPGQSITIKAK